MEVALRSALTTLPDYPVPAQRSTDHDLLQLDDIVSLLQFIKHHKCRLASCILAVLLLAFVYLTVCPRLYTSMAKLLVAQKSPLIVPGMPSAVLHGVDPMSTHIELITSPWLADRVLQDKRLQNAATFADEANPVAVLAGSLKVIHHVDQRAPAYSSSNILEFSFTGPQSQECQSILHAVIDAYRQYLYESSRSINQDASELIALKAEQIRTSLEQKNREYKEFRKSAPLVGSSESASHWIQQRLANLDVSRVSLEMRHAEVNSQLDAFLAATRNGVLTDAALGMLPDGLQSVQKPNLPDGLLPLLREEQQTRTASKAGANHPKVRALREEIDLAQSFYTAPHSAFSANNNLHGEVVQGKDLNLITAFSQKLQQELTGIVAAEQSLSQEIEQLQAELSKELELNKQKSSALAEFELKSEQYRQSISHEQELFDSLMSQLQRIELDIVSGAYSTTLISPPSYANRSSPRTLLVLAVAVFLGLAGGVAASVGSEVADRLRGKGRRKTDLLNHSLYGPAPPVLLHDLQLHNRLANWTEDVLHPSNMLSETTPERDTYQVLSAAVLFKAESQAINTIVITSPQRSEGTSTVAANLAISFAQSGRDVLLVDADLHSPRLNEFFGVAAGRGLVEVLAGECELDEVVKRCGIPRLALLTSGQATDHADELLTPNNLKLLFKLIRERFGYVLIDTPAMLAESDAEKIATNADGVLLTTQSGRSRGSSLLQAEEILEQAGVPILGVVLTEAGEAESTPSAEHEVFHNGAVISARPAMV